MAKNKRLTYTIVLFALFFGLIVVGKNLSFVGTPDSAMSKIDTIDTYDNFQTEMPTEAYSANISGQGATDFNVTLHQSYEASGNPLYEITDFDNEYNRTFQAESPKDANFNSTFSNITIRDIYAPNKTVIVENDLHTQWSNFGADRLAGSFTVPSDFILANISVYIINLAGTNSDIRVRIFNNTYSGGENKPDNSIFTYADNVAFDSYNGWYNFSRGDCILDIDNTDNKIFYVELYDSNDATWWAYNPDSGGGTDGVDEMDAYYVTGPSTWELWTEPPENTKTVDWRMKVHVAPLSNTPKPQQINITINGTQAYGTVGGQGSWNSTNVGGSSTGQLNYTIDADWWDVSCNITNVLVNYTKDLKGTANYYIDRSGGDVQWNITLPSAVDEFRSKFGYYYINYTIPNNWDDTTIEIYNGTDLWASVSDRPLGNGWREVSAQNSGNGTWILSCNSTNLLSSIDMFIQGTSTLITQASSSSKVVFNATFNAPIATDDGTINLTIYNPDSLANILNYTDQIKTFSSGTNITTSTWDVDNTIVGIIFQPLEFRVQMRWNNGTSAGFIENNITLIVEGATNFEGGIKEFRVLRGTLVNYTFNYTVQSNGAPITDAYLEEKSISTGFTYEFINDGNGNYTLRVNTSNVDNANLNIALDFNVSAQKIGRQAQPINLTITVYVPQASGGAVVGGKSGGGGGGGDGDSAVIPGYDLYILIGLICAISAVIIKIRRKRYCITKVV